MPANRNLNKTLVQRAVRMSRAAYAESLENHEDHARAMIAVSSKMDDLGLLRGDPRRGYVLRAVKKCPRPSAQQTLDTMKSEAEHWKAREGFSDPSLGQPWWEDR